MLRAARKLKKNKYGNSQIEKNKHRDSQVFFYLGNPTGSYEKKAEFTDNQGTKTLSQN